LTPAVTVVSKGDDPTDAGGYSAFEARAADGRRLLDCLRVAGVRRLYVGGLATDYCVRASVLDALAAGLIVGLIVDGCRGVELQPGDAARAQAEMQAAGASLIGEKQS
jgi:nicotinamidase/pyrazinamidase